MKKSVIIALAAAGAAVLFLSQTVVKYHFIGNRCANLDKHIEAYPYADAEIPDDFTDYTIHGISLKAPDCLVPNIPEGRTADDAVRYFSNDTEKCDVQIFVYPEKKSPNIPHGKPSARTASSRADSSEKAWKKWGIPSPTIITALCICLALLIKTTAISFRYRKSAHSAKWQYTRK